MTLKKNNPGCDCCGGCSFCPGDLSVSFRNFVNDNCSDCNYYNTTTFLIPWYSETTDDCTWWLQGGSGDCVVDNIEISARLHKVGGFWYWSGSLQFDKGIPFKDEVWNFQLGTGLTTIDCTDTFTLGYNSSYLQANYCTYSGGSTPEMIIN